MVNRNAEAVLQRQNALHRAFAERLFAHDQRAMLQILQAARHNFRALALLKFTSTTIGMPSNSSPCPVGKRYFGVRGGFWPSVETTNCPRGRNFSANFHRLVQQPARVPAQIQNQRLHPLRFELAASPFPVRRSSCSPNCTIRT